MRAHATQRTFESPPAVPSMLTASSLLEEILGPEPALPSQFSDIWHRSRTTTPERQLALAVLWQAILDLRKFRHARRRRHQRFYMEAYAWLMSDRRDWPFSAVNLCEALGISIDALRRAVLEDRGGRALLEEDIPVLGAA